MLEQNRGRSKRVKNLIIICTLLAVVISVGTYAWFIGMRTVNVSSFNVNIASTDSLMLSLDGLHWDTTINIDKDTFDTYTGNTNTWGGANGLIPMSSIGQMDAKASKMMLFEKASLTATPGGYRLLASRVNNYDRDGNGKKTEQDGYVAFDLFVRNFSGTQYLKNLEPLDEEAIYLTTNSTVGVTLDGTDVGVRGTGIENSVRVAFAEIGRVSGITTDQDTITGITCEPDVDGKPSIIGDVTGICRTAQIWEPNDTKHVDAAISWYDNSCVQRTGTGITKGDYNLDPAKVHCATIETDGAYSTYAISKDISSDDKVDIYDGAAYNSYTADTADTNHINADAQLVAYPYFTDTMKGYTGVNRPQLITLAPNSITKIRVYIYIEGQDIDNYDFAQIGKAIVVNFGLTKERFVEGDIGYTGPNLHPSSDVTKPTITLVGDSTVDVSSGTYTDAGATASDLVDGDLTGKIQTINPVDTTKNGKYTITYNVSDAAGNYADTVYRIVNVTGN